MTTKSPIARRSPAEKACTLADLVVIDRDLTAVAPERLREARVVMTIIGGRVVYQAP
ncbi:MAG TPA: amidohydrolase family protein [Haliangiales bacterium]|nr:amidohydrolase family protein [Haliangiales bacterium]